MKGFFKKGHEFFEPKDKVRRVEENETTSLTTETDTDTQTQNANQSQPLSTSPSQSQSTPTTPTSNQPNPKRPNSRSKMKLLNKYEWHSSDESDCELDVGQTEEFDSDASNSVNDHSSGFRVIDLDILKQQIVTDLVCRHCGASSELIEEKRCGLGSSFKFVCCDKKCKKSKTFFSDPAVKVKESGLINHSVNRRLALSMRLIGCGLTATRTFCGMMNLPPPVLKTSFAKIKESINQAVTTVQSDSMKEAADTEYKLNEMKGMFHFFLDVLFT